MDLFLETATAESSIMAEVVFEEGLLLEVGSVMIPFDISVVAANIKLEEEK